MQNQEEIDRMLNKLHVLESRIQQLKSITDEVLHEVNEKYLQEIKELSRTKDKAEQKLKKSLGAKLPGNSETIHTPRPNSPQ